MISYEIWWDDLTEEAQERLQELWHENIDISPIAIIEIEEEEIEEEPEIPTSKDEEE